MVGAVGTVGDDYALNHIHLVRPGIYVLCMCVCACVCVCVSVYVWRGGGGGERGLVINNITP